MAMATLAILLTSVASADVCRDRVIAVVVHPQNPIVALDRQEVEHIFRGETVHWPNGNRIQVIDYPADAALRIAFYRATFGTGPEGQRPEGSPIPFTPMKQRNAASMLRLLPFMSNMVSYVWDEDVGRGVKVVASLAVRQC